MLKLAAGAFLTCSHMPRNLFLACFIIFLFGSCRDDRSGSPGDISMLADVNMEDIFLDYRISAEEGDNNLNIVLQFRDGSEDGRTLVVGDAGKVELDGEPLIADSAELSGAFYEIQKPINAFSGEHKIILSGPGGKEFSETFVFYPMTLNTPIADTMRREDWVLELGGLEKVDYVRVVMVDTSFINEGINRVDTVYGGRLLIRRADLEELHNGDIHLELYRENERPTRNGGEAGGRFSMTYAIKRDFILWD